jgi:hypothetical protein
MSREKEIYQSVVDKQSIEEDSIMESEYINNNLQLIQKEIEPHSKDIFEIISRDLQQGNIHEGGMMYMVSLESYHRSLTYASQLAQKIKPDYEQSYEVIDPSIDLSKVNWSNREEIENLKRVIITKKIQTRKYYTVENYEDKETQKMIEVKETVTEIPLLKNHILNSPLERGAHFVVVSNSVEGFLRKNRRTLTRDINSKNMDSIEAGKPIIYNKQSRENQGGSW